jgi:uncharacterized lipoprotein YbaY
MAQSEAVTVRGTIVSDAPVAPIEDAVVRVQLQDVSVADAAATVVSEQTLRDVALQGSPREIATYELHAGNLDRRRQYSVWVHVDLDSDGALSPGDLVSTRSYPVDASERTSTIDVRVSAI